MMGQKSNRGPINQQPRNTGPENIPGSGFKKRSPGSPFDGLVKPTPVFGEKINGNMRMATQKEWEESQRVADSTISNSKQGKQSKPMPNRY